MAVRGGFEPPIHFRIYTLSRRAPSTTRTSHRNKQKDGRKYINIADNFQAFYLQNKINHFLIN